MSSLRLFRLPAHRLVAVGRADGALVLVAEPGVADPAVRVLQDTRRPASAIVCLVTLPGTRERLVAGTEDGNLTLWNVRKVR